MMRTDRFENCTESMAGFAGLVDAGLAGVGLADVGWEGTYLAVGKARPHKDLPKYMPFHPDDPAA